MSVEKLGSVVGSQAIPTKRSELTERVVGLKTKTSARDVAWPLPQIPFFVIMSGRPNSGKTNLWLNFLKDPEMYYQKFDRVYIYSNTKHTIDPKTLKLPKERVFEGFNLEHFNQEAFKSQEELQAEIHKNSTVSFNLHSEDPDGYCKATVRHHKPPPVHQLFVMDDVVTDVNLNSETVLKAILNRRHWNCSVIICTQKYNLLSLAYRVATSGVFFWHTNNLKEIEAFREELCQLPPRTFYMMLNQIWAEPKQFLFFKQDDPKTHLFPFFKGFDRLEICNINSKLLADGTMPDAPENVLATQREMGLVEDNDAAGDDVGEK